MLSTTGWLSNVAQAFREAMLEIAVWRIAGPGEEFVHNGVTEGGMFAVASGTAEVSLYLGHPDTRMIHIAQPGFWAGNRPLFGRTRQVSLVAREEVVWGLFPQGKVERLLHEEPAWWRHIGQLMDDAFILSIGILGDLTLHSSRKRAIAVLMRSAGCRYSDAPPGQISYVSVSQDDLAAMAVMSRNTFNGIIRELTDLRLIAHGYRKIELVEPARLRALLDD